MPELVEETQTESSLAGELKPGWRVVRFGDVVRNVDVSERQPLEKGLERFVGLEHLDPESLHIKRWGLIAEGTSFTRKFVHGQVLFGKRRAYQRKAAVAEFDGICSGDILVFEPKGDELLSELLPFIVQSDGFFEHALGTSAGSLSPRTKWSDLARYEFALPLKGEQCRIADILWAADEAVEKGDELVKSTSLVKKAILADSYKSSSSQQVEIGDYAEFVTSGSRGWAQYYSSEGSIFIRVANLTREHTEIDLTDLQYVSPPSGAEGLRTRVLAGDILISVTADLGRIAVVPPDFSEAYMNQHVALVRLNTKQMNPYYVAQYLLSVEGQNQFRVFNDAGAKAGMNLKNIRRLKVPQLQLCDQEKLVGQIRALDMCISQAQEHLKTQIELKKKLLFLLKPNETLMIA